MVVLISVLILWIVSLCLHEYSHARVAYAGGDFTVVDKGYLTLNPLKYMHPLLSIVLPVVILLFGGIPLPGGAVYINTGLLRSRHWQAAVSAAGPLANLALLFAAGLLFRTGLLDGVEAGAPTPLAQSTSLFGFFMAFAFILNMLPVPGLDGFGILEPYLPRPLAEAARQFGMMGILLLLIVLMQVPEARIALFRMASWLTMDLAGISGEAFQEGRDTFFAALGRRGG